MVLVRINLWFSNQYFYHSLIQESEWQFNWIALTNLHFVLKHSKSHQKKTNEEKKLLVITKGLILATVCSIVTFCFSFTINLFFIYLFIYLFYLFFIYSWLTANEITVHNKNNYAYIRANWRQLLNIEKMKNCKLNINLKTWIKS